MKLLAIEASTKTGSCAVFGNDGLLGEITLNTDITHSERLMPGIIYLMKSLKLTFKDLNAIAISIGPGSFTALRIGISTAKGIAFASNLPLIGIPTLQALAERIIEPNSVICPFLDARKKEVYFALYKRDHDGSLLQLKREKAAKVEEMCKSIKRRTIFLGNGVEVYGEKVKQILREMAIFTPKAQRLPTASTVAEIGYRIFLNNNYPKDLSSVRPIYLRPSDAEIAFDRKKIIS